MSSRSRLVAIPRCSSPSSSPRAAAAWRAAESRRRRRRASASAERRADARSRSGSATSRASSSPRSTSPTSTGYYDEAGLDVEFQNKIDPDLITLVGQGAIDVGIADGTSVIPAVSQGIPVQYLATIYGKFPSIVFAKASSGITDAADLKGKKLGIPGRYGSSWIMLQALLGSAGLTPDDLTIVEYPDFGQGAAVQQGAVDAATGFANNEPVQLELTGEKATVLRVDDITPLPGPGLIGGDGDARGQARRDRRVRRGDPAGDAGDHGRPRRSGLDAAIAAVPELGVGP